MDKMAGLVVVPGEEICAVTDGLVAGEGSYIDNGSVFASIVGKVKLVDAAEGSSKRVSVERSKSKTQPNVVPAVGDVVTCRILRVNPRLAQAEILCVGPKPVQGVSFRAVVRKENVRQSEVDKVQMADSFRPGDIVRAKVAALGSARSFELSTAEQSLGVVSWFTV